MPGFIGGSSSGASSAGGEIKFPKEFIDPVTKLRVSQPENLIDTDFEYGLQPTKWETVELINNTPSFFSKSGDTTIPGIVSINTNSGTREITVTTSLDHGLAVGIPINVQGTKSVTADGSYIINSIPDTKTFTYLSRDIQDNTSAIEDLYTSVITGEFFQGSQLRIAESDGIVTDAEATSTLTVTTENPHGFGPNTPFYFLNLNSTISQEFEAANTAAKAFDASNSATAQTFDGSNSLSSLNIDWSNSATVGGTTSSVDNGNSTDNTLTVTHSTENFSGLPVGQPLYYNVSASLGYFADNPRGVVFLKNTNNLGESTSIFQVSEVPDGPAINIESNVTGTIQIANQARTFAGNNVNSNTETVINVVRDSAIEIEGANDQSLGGNGVATATSYSGTSVTLSTSAGAGLDYYVGAMLKYETTGTAATGLTADATYFVASFQDNNDDTYTITLKDLPTDSDPISISGGTGTQTFSRIGISTDKNIVHIKDSFFSRKDMLEYEFPTNGNFVANEEKSFYFVINVFDQHNYQLNPVFESFIEAFGGDVVQTVQYENRDYTVHRFTTEGSYTFTITDEGTFGQSMKYVVSDGSFQGDAGVLVEDSFAPQVQTYTVVVNAGGRVDLAYPQDSGPNDIPFSVINPILPEATGGSISDITVDGREYRVHTFSSTGTSSFVINSTGNISDEIEYLIVAGGGGGGQVNDDNGGGGGGGGVLSGSLQISAQSYSVVVGAGGTEARAASSETAARGGSSSFGNLTANGGGGGGGYLNRDGGTIDSAGFTGFTGGSSGGSSVNQAPVSPSPAGQGFIGGDGLNGWGGGGGGGGGGVGGNAVATSTGLAGEGGIGFLSSITGTPTRYAGGGGGGGTTRRQIDADLAGAGGSGGGGRGASHKINSTSGQPNTGGGGGGGGGTSQVSGGIERRASDGGSGIVIVRYPLEPDTSGGI